MPGAKAEPRGIAHYYRCGREELDRHKINYTSVSKFL
jgi:hypothetical protein